MQRRWLVIWYVLLALLFGEAAVYGVVDYAANYCRQEVRRQFNAAAAEWQQVDKVPYAAMINRYGRGAGVSARLVASVIQAESSFRPRAVSRTGAMGLMQVMPGTWRQIADELQLCGGRHDGDCTPECYFDPELNIRVGTAYLGKLTQTFGGDLTLALAAYNAGPGAVKRYGDIPPFRETEDYVDAVRANWYALGSQSEPPFSQAARRWQEVRRVIGWIMVGTGGLALWTVGKLKLRRRSWRWH
ncbi:MAG: lytic transglycosylase domain-containing protein [Negativicutes bacterium]|nr:lytic transglycosylase domain-containing protein [Negativicutes bacterium]